MPGLHAERERAVYLEVEEDEVGVPGQSHAGQGRGE